MRGKVIGKALNPQAQEYSITITLTIEDWTLLLKQMNDSKLIQHYPGWHVIDGITNVIANANESFSKDIE